MSQAIEILAITFVLSSGSRSHVIAVRRKERVFSYSFGFQSIGGAQFWNTSIHWPSWMLEPPTKSCYLLLPMSLASWCPFVFLHLPLKLVLDPLAANMLLTLKWTITVLKSQGSLNQLFKKEAIGLCIISAGLVTSVICPSCPQVPR